MNNSTFEKEDLKDICDYLAYKPIHQKPKYFATIESLCNMEDDKFMEIINNYDVTYSTETGMYILGRYNKIINETHK